MALITGTWAVGLAVIQISISSRFLEVCMTDASLTHLKVLLIVTALRTKSPTPYFEQHRCFNRVECVARGGSSYPFLFENYYVLNGCLHF